MVLRHLNNAFRITIGHELTHKDKEFCPLKVLHYGIGSYIFVKKLNEVRADFGASQKMFNGKRENLLISCEYKRVLRDKYGGTTEDKSHFNWETRKKYAEEYNFNEELIRQIAKDLKYNNEKVIQMVCDYYDDIILT